MDRIAIQKSTGNIIEYQSGDSELGTLTQNAINAGYDEADVEEKYISQEDYKTLADAEYEASLTYAEKRKQEYDKLNQWEMHFDDQRDGTTTWIDSINEIKTRFPK